LELFSLEEKAALLPGGLFLFALREPCALQNFRSPQDLPDKEPRSRIVAYHPIAYRDSPVAMKPIRFSPMSHRREIHGSGRPETSFVYRHGDRRDEIESTSAIFANTGDAISSFIAHFGCGREENL
jgi:hypothetical protein